MCDVKERIHLIRLSKKIASNKEFANKIGISVITTKKSKRSKEKRWLNMLKRIIKIILIVIAIIVSLAILAYLFLLVTAWI